MSENTVEKKQAVIHIGNDRTIFAAMILGILCLAGVIYPFRGTFLGRIFAGGFGVFSNMAVIFYGLAAALAAWKIYERQDEIRKHMQQQKMRETFSMLRVNLGVILLSVLMIGEQLQWLIPLLVKDPQSYVLFTFKDLIVLSLRNLPDKAGLEVAMAIGIGRFILIAAPLYGLGCLIYYRNRIQDYINNPANENPLFYGGSFAIFVLISILLLMMFGREDKLVVHAAELCTSVSLLFFMLTKKEQPGSNMKGKAKN